MNSRKNPSPAALLLATILIPVSMTGCASLFRHDRSAEPPETAQEKGRNSANTYAATDDGASPDLKDKKIQSLEVTVTTLNSRIQELEGKLQAARNPPTLDQKLAASTEKSDRQNLGERVHPSVAASDPGAGFVNDANVRAFQQGKILFDQEKYPEAVLAFSAFLERNEKHTLASNAQYYIAESYFREGDFAVADQEFQKLVLRYPNSSRVSFALVRLADCSEKTGKLDEARRYRDQAVGLYAKSPALRGSRLSEINPPAAAEPITPPAAANPSVPPIATAPDAPSEMAAAPAAPNVPIEKPIAPSAPVAPKMDSDLDAPPGAAE